MEMLIVARFVRCHLSMLPTTETGVIADWGTRGWRYSDYSYVSIGQATCEKAMKPTVYHTCQNYNKRHVQHSCKSCDLWALDVFRYMIYYSHEVWLKA